MDIANLSYTQAKQQLRKYRILWTLDIIALILCIGCLSASLIIRTQAYNTAITISPATDTATKKAAYLQAIEISPKEPDAYLLLLDTAKEDDYFSKLESDDFLRCYNRNHKKMDPGHELYPQLHATAGLMYINHYEADLNTKIRKAIPFLNEAKQHLPQDDPLYLPVSYYCEIGDFCQNYLWNTSALIREIEPEKMQEMVAEIDSMVLELKKNEAPDMINVQLGFYIIVNELLYIQRDTLAKTVDQASVMTLFEHIYEDLPEVKALQNTHTQNQRKILEQDMTFYRNALEEAYEGA